MAATDTIFVPPRFGLRELEALQERWPPLSTATTVSLSQNRWVEPAGMVGLACLIDRFRRLGGRIEVDHRGCNIVGYYERMGFFRETRLSSPPPSGSALPASGRFAEMRRVLDIDEVDSITSELVAVTACDLSSRRTLSHILSEAANNVCQHSHAAGFSAAQFYRGGNRVHLCIADSGRGLRHALEARYQPVNDAAAIALALRVGVTSNPPIPLQSEMRNRGVGLSCIERLVTENGGHLEIWSGNGRFTSKADYPYHHQTSWPGTLISIEIPRNGLTADFRVIMGILTEELRAAEKSSGRGVGPVTRGGRQ